VLGPDGEVAQGAAGRSQGRRALEAWADCATLVFDLPKESFQDAEHGEAMELCIDGVQRGIEFVFGGNLVEDADFSTLVLQWATSRWFHAAAWQQGPAETKAGLPRAAEGPGAQATKATPTGQGAVVALAVPAEEQGPATPVVGASEAALELSSLD